MKILFICTGNTCRSPMAQCLMNYWAEKNGKNISADSAGVFAQEGDLPSENAVKAMLSYGCDLSSHRAKKVNATLISNADIIYAMTEDHAKFLTDFYPESKIKLKILGNGIPDPYGQNLNVYKSCAETIFDKIKEINI